MAVMNTTICRLRLCCYVYMLFLISFFVIIIVECGSEDIDVSFISVLSFLEILLIVATYIALKTLRIMMAQKKLCCKSKDERDKESREFLA